MRQYPRHVIERYVNETLRPFWNNLGDTGMENLPYDPEKLVKRHGGSVVICTPDAWNSEWGSGYIKVLPDGGFEIGVPHTTGENRDRFTIAHELGHLYLHLNFTDREKWNKRVESAKKENGKILPDSFMTRAGQGYNEYEANDFAAALLMPANEFREVVQDRSAGQMGIHAVATKFGVSAEAVMTRGRFLGIFPWS